jgi:hypothetical protein
MKGFKMSVFGKLKNQLQLNHEAQGPYNLHSWMYLLLSELDRYESANPMESDVLTSPEGEILRRLSRYNDTFAYQQLATFLAPRVK